MHGQDDERCRRHYPESEVYPFIRWVSICDRAGEPLLVQIVSRTERC